MKFAKIGSRTVLLACTKEEVGKFREDLKAAGLTEEEIKFQLKDP